MTFDQRQRWMMFVLLPAAIALSFTLPYPLGIIQAAVAGFSLGSKLAFYYMRRRFNFPGPDNTRAFSGATKTLAASGRDTSKNP